MLLMNRGGRLPTRPPLVLPLPDGDWKEYLITPLTRVKSGSTVDSS